MSAETHTAPDSMRSRYVVTLGAQGFRMLLSLITATIVPRTLGPAVYGSYSFLLSTATALRGVLDNSTQQAFFTFSAQERASGSLTRLYGLVLLGQLLTVLAIIATAAMADKTEWLWRAQPVDKIMWVTLLEWLTYLALSLQQLGDSKGLTVRLQLIGAVVSAVTLVGLLLLWFGAALTFHTFVWLNTLGTAVNCALLGYWLVVRNGAIIWNGGSNPRDYIARWWRFARPLLLLQYYLPLVPYLGIYLIERWYGSQEQGYYALANQWCAFALVFTTAAVWIFWREIAHHSGSGDLGRTSAIYAQFSGLFFCLGLALACWLSASSALLVRIIAGERFADARQVLAIMAFYPVAQTIGQLTMVCLRATERTGSYARWSLVLSIPDLCLTYLLLAPVDAPVPGLHLGAVGLAIKTAGYGLISAHVYDWVNCRYLRIDFLATLARRALASIAVGLVALVALDWGSSQLLRAGVQNVAALVLASCGYAVALLMLIWFWPRLAGLTREQIVRHLRPLYRF